MAKTYKIKDGRIIVNEDIAIVDYAVLLKYDMHLYNLPNFSSRPSPGASASGRKPRFFASLRMTGRHIQNDKSVNQNFKEGPARFEPAPSVYQFFCLRKTLIFPDRTDG